MATPDTVPQFSLPSEHRLRLSFAGRERWSDIFSTLVYVFLDFLWRSQLKSAPRTCGFRLGLGFLAPDRRLFSAFPWRWRFMISNTAPAPQPLQVPRSPWSSLPAPPLRKPTFSTKRADFLPPRSISRVKDKGKCLLERKGESRSLFLFVFLVRSLVAWVLSQSSKSINDMICSEL